MKFRSKNTVKPEFNMASMTDLIFLLLIFFMLTSNLVTPTALPVNLPSSKEGIIEIQKVNVTVTEDLEYFVNERKVVFSKLEEEIKSSLKGEKYQSGDKTVPVVVLHIDKTVDVEYLVKVAGIVNGLGAKISLATKSE
ncbi:biopolymer transporter ExbD [Cytophagaceae bacterium ABcell3]|nr:biopolymer transporter ExbD [Cytophagaceae bacterium ABcell3]